MNTSHHSAETKATPLVSAARRIMKDAVDSLARTRRLHEELHAIDPESIPTYLASETVIDAETHLLRCVLASGKVDLIAGVGGNFCRKSRPKGVILGGILYVAVPTAEGEFMAEGERSRSRSPVMALHLVDLGDVVSMDA